ncbi:TnsD family Tn7-like transposition protein [Methyloglobulus sp.]|uniref:TnsD family Tn7-like transposition protein n=1 Tax=Methyloglobulus sp. TaxID=2518622 RepID=UPI0032B70745
MLNRPQHKSATFAQWSAFYRHLAVLNDCRKGKRVDYEAIRERTIAKWPIRWLREQRLNITGQGNDWWVGLFRKHRKSYNYLQHIVVLHSLMPDGWTIAEVLGEVNNMQIKPNTKTRLPEQSKIPLEPLENYRNNWERLVGEHGIKSARSGKPGGAIYAWLYRHDTTWLLAFNDEHGLNPKPQKLRVNWEARDKHIVGQLILIRKNHVNQLHHPQMTRNWYLSKFNNHSSVEKNLFRLPQVKLFFERYCEQLADYQIRRINRVMADAQISGQHIKHWHVFREAGLSEERITEKARDYLINKMGVSIA